MDPELIRQIHQLTGATGLSDADFIAISQLIAGTHKTRKIDLGSLIDYIGGPGGIDLAPNSGLAFEDGKLTTKFNTQIPDITDNIEVGGAAATGADYWKTQNLVNTFNKILFPDLSPTYVLPTLNLTGTHSGLFEVGSVINQQLTLTGTKNDAGAFTQLTILRNGTSLYSTSSPTTQATVNLPNQFNFSDPNNPNYNYIANYTNNFVVTAGNTVWSGKGNYSSGLAKKNNKNVTDTRTALVGSVDAPQAAKTNLLSNEITVTGYYPYFWGKISSAANLNNSYMATQIQNGSALKVAAEASGDISITFNANEEYVWIAVPSTYPVKTKWYNSSINNGTIGIDQFINNNGSYAVSTNLWSGVNFNIYVSSWPSVTEGVITLKN